MLARRYLFARHGRPEDITASFRVESFRHDRPSGKGVGLSTEGREQARRLATALERDDIGRVVASGLQRAVETAEVLRDTLGAPLDAGWSALNELSPGVVPGLGWVHGLTWSSLPAQVRRPLGDATRGALSTATLAAWWHGRTCGGEPRVLVLERIREALARLDALPEERVVVVGHGYWIALMAFAVVAPNRQALRQLRWVAHCSVTELAADGHGRYALRAFATRKAPSPVY